jgi:MraZ protein
VFVFLGTYNYKLDDKNRIRIPAKFRAVLSDNFFLLPGANNCLYVMGEEVVKTLLEKLETIPLSHLEAQKAKSNFLAAICSPEVDAQGRFTLPQGLKSYAAIGKGIYFVGAMDKIEIWSQETYEEKNIFGKTSFEENMSVFKGYGF